MQRAFSLMLLVGGIILIIYGINASESVAPSFSRFFKGTPTDNTIWLVAGGVAAAVLGLVGVRRDSRS
jgi:hypothetical protein